MTAQWARVSRNLALVLSSTGFQAVCSLGALALNARALGSDAFGTLAIIQAYASLVSSFTALSTWQAVIRIGKASRTPLGPTLAGGMLVDGTAAMAGTLVALGGILLFAPALGIAEPVRWLAAVYCLSLLFGLTGTPKGYLRLIGRYDILVWCQAAHAFALLSVSVLLLALRSPLATYVIVFASLEALYGAAVMTTFLVLARPEGLARSVKPKSRRFRLHLARMVRVVLGTSLLSALLSAQRRLPVIIAAGALGPHGTGPFALAARLASIVPRAAVAANQVVFPEMVAVSTWRDRRAALRLVMTMTAVAAVLLGCASALVHTFAVAIVVVAGGEEFRSAATPFTLLFAAECAVLAGMPLHALVQGLKGVRPLLVITCVSFVLLIALAAVLAPSLGATGVALACLIAAVLAYAGALAAAISGLLATQQGAGRAVELAQTAN